MVRIGSNKKGTASSQVAAIGKRRGSGRRRKKEERINAENTCVADRRRSFFLGTAMTEPHGVSGVNRQSEWTL